MGTYALTGGATGIGHSIKQQLLAANHRLIVIDIKDADIIADLSEAEGRQRAIAGIRKAAPDGLDGLITSAGLGANASKLELIASVNYFGTVELAEALADLVAIRRGTMVLVSSNSAPMAEDTRLIEAFLEGNESQAREIAKTLNGHAVYSCSKQAVTRWMRRNVKPFAAKGVRLNAVAPGYTQTPMTAAVENDPVYAEPIKRFVESIPVGYPGQPSDIANPVMFLLTPEARYICGSLVFIDGGHDAMLRPDQF